MYVVMRVELHACAIWYVHSHMCSWVSTLFDCAGNRVRIGEYG